MSGPAERRLRGHVASRGLALGRIVLGAVPRLGPRASGSPQEERAALEAALVRATAELETLIEAADDVGAEILEFQVALLGDDDLTEPVFARVGGGVAADAAWRDVLDAEIRTYRQDGDEVLAARAADLVDLRDRVLRALMPEAGGDPGATPEADAILAAADLTPSRFLEIDWTRFRGAILRDGNAAGHVAVLARARGAPVVVGLGEEFEVLREGALAVLDAEEGQVLLDPLPATLHAAEARLDRRAAAADRANRFRGRPAITANGERIVVTINVDDPSLLDAIDPGDTDGIGLTRTEFLFQGGALPDEARQLDAYARILRWADGRPVVVRTLDAGGDKPIAGLTPTGDANPFLGLRGLRLSLARPDVLRVQLRALARAATMGALQVMVPMVTVPAELAAFRRLFGEVVDELRAEGVDADLPPLGMMVEVPAAALTAGDFEADFYSIGSNDLIQYAMAASRDNPAVAGLYDPANPAVLELIGRAVAAGQANGRAIGLCGDLASDPRYVPRLLDLGLRRLSVTPSALGPVKEAIAAWRPT